MIIPHQKLQENIAEYVIYMLQVQDVIRAFQFDLDRIMTEYVAPQESNDELQQEYRTWFASVIRDMQDQRIQKTGMLVDLREILVELSYLHNTLLNTAGDNAYRELMDKANPVIEEFKAKSNLKDKNHIEVAFNGLYMKLLMRLQRREISAETNEAFDMMTALLAHLAKAYHKMKSGDLDFLNN